MDIKILLCWLEATDLKAASGVEEVGMGTPAMAAAWILLAKTSFPSELIESSKDHGVRLASVLFDISGDISGEFLPDLLNKPDKAIERLAAGIPAEAPDNPCIHHPYPMRLSGRPVMAGPTPIRSCFYR
jgi:hypothetical protein